MENLDDFIREQFEQDDPAGRFPFREAYWEQALPLIEVAGRKRRRALWWWWLTGLLLLGGGWAGWQWSKQTANQAENRLQARQESSFPADRQTPDQEADLAREETATGLNKPEPKDFPAMTSQTAAQQNASANLPHQAAGAPSWVSGSSFNKDKTTDSHPLNQPSATVIIPAIAPSVPAAAYFPGKESTPDTTHVMVNSVTWPAMTELPTAFWPLTSPTGQFAPARVPAKHPVIKPLRKPVFAFGLHLTGTAYHAAPQGRNWGTTLGIYTQYWLHPNWSLSAGLAWRSQPVELSVPDTLANVQQLYYRFGYEKNTFRETDRQLQFIELPVALHRHYRAWQMEAGAGYGRLTGVRTVRTQTYTSSLTPTPEVTEKRILGQLGPYRRSYTTFFAGLGWQPLPRVQLTIRGTYRPAALITPGNETDKPPGALWLDAGLRWHLFSHDRIRTKR